MILRTDKVFSAEVLDQSLDEASVNAVAVGDEVKLLTQNTSSKRAQSKCLQKLITAVSARSNRVGFCDKATKKNPQQDATGLGTQKRRRKP